MSCLRASFRDRGPRAETEAMESQNAGQEHEIIELQEDNVEENEADHDKPLNAQTRKETQGPGRGPGLIGVAAMVHPPPGSPRLMISLKTEGGEGRAIGEGGGSVHVMPSKVQSVQAGGNITFSCQLAMKDVLQVTWQKEVDGAEDNIATYSAMNGQKIAKDYAGHVSFAHSELQTSGISLREVTLEDEGCYKCIFNTFPSGAVTGRMCLKVYAISDPKVEAKLIPSPDKTENSEQVVGLSCSATGKPAPKIIWRLPTILQQKPREYHIRLGNQTVTVISNFTHTHSKILQEHPIACVILHPSLNVTLVLPRDSLAQGPSSSVAPSIVIAVGVLVPLTSLLLLACLLHYCLRHLSDPERNPTWPCWVFPACTKAKTHGQYRAAGRWAPAGPPSPGMLLNT